MEVAPISRLYSANMSNVRSALSFLGIILAVILALAGQTASQSSSEREWWADTLVYQVWPKSFQDSDGDGTGDIQGITNHLDYFEDLGVETIWLNAIYPSPLTDSGYDVSDFEDIDSTYGSLTNFDELITAAHARGLKVIVDFIPNHSSVEHPWFNASVYRTDPYTDYYVWHNGIVNTNGVNVAPNNWMSTVSNDEGSAWQWNEIRGQWYLHQFSVGEADFDLKNEAVVEELLGVLDFWLNRGVDGFYVNSVPYFFEDENFADNSAGSSNNTFGLTDNVALLYRFREHIDSWVSLNDNVSKFLVAEGIGDDENLVEYYGNETSEGIAPVNTQFITDITSSSNATYIKNTIDSWISALPANQTTNWKLSNQDYSRVATRYGLNRADGLNMFIMALPGRVFTYYGEEIAMLDNEDITYAETVDSLACAAGVASYSSVSRDPFRTPMQWDATSYAGFTDGSSSYLPVHSSYTTRNTVTQLAKDSSNIKTYKAAAALRSTSTLIYGDYEIQALNNDRVLVLRRSLEDDFTYIVVVNLGLAKLTVNLAEVYSDLPTSMNISVLSANAVLSGSSLAVADFTLTANAAVILTDAPVDDVEEGVTTTEVTTTEVTTTEVTTTEATATEATATDVDGNDTTTEDNVAVTNEISTTTEDEEVEGPTTETPDSSGFATTPATVGIVISLCLSFMWTYYTHNRVDEITGELDWWQTAVIYQIYTKSFQDSNGDGIGDLQGIISRLDYLEDTGVTGFTLTPIYPSPQIDGGYDISDFRNIDSIFGSLQDFDELVNTAHTKNLKVILDFVPNHSSDEHIWFQNSVARIEPYTDYYVWSDGITSSDGDIQPPNNWLSVFGGSAWTWNQQRQQYYLHQFHTKQPDLNFRNPDVITELTDVLIFWLSRGVDGFRISSVAHLFEDATLRDEPVNENSGSNIIDTDHDYLQHIYTTDLDETLEIVYQWRAVVDQYALESDGRTRVLITDSAAEQDVVLRYFGNGTHQGAHLPLNFAIIANLTQRSTASAFIDVFNEWLLATPENYVPNWILGTHDYGRVASRLSLNRADGLNMLQLLPGTAFTYMGEELALLDTLIDFDNTQDPHAINAGPDRFHLFTRDPARTPYHWDATISAGFSTSSSPWLPVNSNYNFRNLAFQTAAERSNYKTYKAILELKQTDTIRRGSTQFLSLHFDTVLAFARELTGYESYVIVMNLGLGQMTVDLTGFPNFPTENIHVLLASANSISAPGDPINLAAVPLSANAALVLHQREMDDITETPISPEVTTAGSSTPTTTTTATPSPPIFVNDEILGDLDWWQGASVYQIYPKSFQDSNGDGFGDLQGIISRLDHLDETGVTAIWLNSIFESPQIDGGFDVSNFFAIDPIFGTLEDFAELIRQAHARVMKVIIDFVPNHSSAEHIWFQNSIARIEPYSDYYVWRDGVASNNGVQPPNNWLSVFGGSAWTWNEQRQQYYLHQFHSSQPDLNFRNPAVVAEITNVLEFWLAQGVDGFRISSVAHLFEDASFPNEPLNPYPDSNGLETDWEYLQHIYTTNLDETIEIVYQWRSVVDQYATETDGQTRILITDSVANQDTISRYFGNQTHQGAHLPMNFDIVSKLTHQSLASSYVNTVREWYAALPEYQTSNWLLGSHDHGRVASRFGFNRADGLNMLHLLPGTAFIYMGEELALLNTQLSFAETQDPHAINAGPDRFHLFTRDPARTPYPWDDSVSGGFSTSTSTWLPINANYVVRNLASQITAERSNFNTFKAILELKQSETIKRGATRISHLNDDSVLAFTRELQGEPVLAVAINLGLSTVNVDLSGFSGLQSGEIRVCIASSNAIITNGTVVNVAAVPLSANAAVVLCNTEVTDTPTAVTTTRTTTAAVTTTEPVPEGSENSTEQTTEDPNGGATAAYVSSVLLIACLWSILV